MFVRRHVGCAGVAAALCALACGGDATPPRVWRPTWAGVVAGPSGELGTIELSVDASASGAIVASGSAAFTFAPRRFALVDDGSADDTLRVTGVSETIYGRLRCSADRAPGDDDALRGRCALDDGAERPLALVAHDGEARRVCGNYFWPDDDGVLSIVASARAIGAVAYGARVRWSATASRAADVAARLAGPLAIDGDGLRLDAELAAGGATGTFTSSRARGAIATNPETCPQRP